MSDKTANMEASAPTFESDGKEFAIFWRKLMWFTAALALPAWLVYLYIDGKDARDLAAFLVRLAVFNAGVSIPVMFILWVPMPKEAPQNLLRGVFLIIFCSFLAIMASFIAQHHLEKNGHSSYGYEHVRALWLGCALLISRLPFSFRYRFKAVALPALLSNWIAVISVAMFFVTIEFPQIAIPFLEMPFLHGAIGWLDKGF